MSATSDPTPLDPLDAGAGPTTSEAFGAVCPYLVAANGAWRSVEPTRDHRCSATDPAALPAPAKQRDVCLRASHVQCATYRAARELEAEAAPARPSPDGGLWPVATSTVLALEPPRARAFLLGGSRARSVGQLLLVALMIVAFGVLVVARTTAPPGAPGSSVTAGLGGSSAAVSPSGGVSSPTSMPVATPSATLDQPSSTPAASPAVSPRPSATPTETYKVRRGDTLSSIAVANGITVRKLKKANDLSSNLINVGQVLIIP